MSLTNFAHLSTMLGERCSSEFELARVCIEERSLLAGQAKTEWRRCELESPFGCVCGLECPVKDCLISRTSRRMGWDLVADSLETDVLVFREDFERGMNESLWFEAKGSRLESGCSDEQDDLALTVGGDATERWVQTTTFPFPHGGRLELHWLFSVGFNMKCGRMDFGSVSIQVAPSRDGEAPSAWTTVRTFAPADMRASSFQTASVAIPSHGSLDSFASQLSIRLFQANARPGFDTWLIKRLALFQARQVPRVWTTHATASGAATGLLEQEHDASCCAQCSECRRRPAQQGQCANVSISAPWVDARAVAAGTQQGESSFRLVTTGEVLSVASAMGGGVWLVWMVVCCLVGAITEPLRWCPPCRCRSKVAPIAEEAVYQERGPETVEAQAGVVGNETPREANESFLFPSSRYIDEQAGELDRRMREWEAGCDLSGMFNDGCDLREHVVHENVRQAQYEEALARADDWIPPAEHVLPEEDDAEMEIAPPLSVHEDESGSTAAKESASESSVTAEPVAPEPKPREEEPRSLRLVARWDVCWVVLRVMLAACVGPGLLLLGWLQWTEPPNTDRVIRVSLYPWKNAWMDFSGSSFFAVAAAVDCVRCLLAVHDMLLPGEITVDRPSRKELMDFPEMLRTHFVRVRSGCCRQTVTRIPLGHISRVRYTTIADAAGMGAQFLFAVIPWATATGLVVEHSRAIAVMLGATGFAQLMLGPSGAMALCNVMWYILTLFGAAGEAIDREAFVQAFVGRSKCRATPACTLAWGMVVVCAGLAVVGGWQLEMALLNGEDAQGYISAIVVGAVGAMSLLRLAGNTIDMVPRLGGGGSFTTSVDPGIIVEYVTIHDKGYEFCTMETLDKSRDCHHNESLVLFGLGLRDVLRETMDPIKVLRSMSVLKERQLAREQEAVVVLQPVVEQVEKSRAIETNRFAPLADEAVATAEAETTALPRSLGEVRERMLELLLSNQCESSEAVTRDSSRQDVT
jgi:hypothetical protein